MSIKEIKQCIKTLFYTLIEIVHHFPIVFLWLTKMPFLIYFGGINILDAVINKIVQQHLGFFSINNLFL